MKTFVLDTNVLIHDPNSIYVFEDNRVVIPMTVIEELDKLKRYSDERAKNSRIVSSKLDALRSRGSIIEGVKMDNGGILNIELDWDLSLPENFVQDKADHRILAVALKLKKQGQKVIFITKDINLRIKAEALGITTQDYEKLKVKIEDLYTGIKEIKVSDEIVDILYNDGKVKIEVVNNFLGDLNQVFLNEFFILRSSKSHSALAKLKKFETGETFLVLLVSKNSTVWGLKPLNVQQRFAIDLLLDEKVNLVTLIGVAGAGKTLLSLACGLHKVIDEKAYRRLLISRPVFPMGRDIGYLPGTKEEKLSSWMGAIYDNLEYLIENTGKNEKDWKNTDAVNHLFNSGIIEVEALTYLRGRSLPNQYFIIDDAQNLTPHEVKTIISRAGENTKIVLTGDPFQIDNPYLDASSNGLTYLVDKFKGQDVFGHIMFDRSERSKLAALAAEIL